MSGKCLIQDIWRASLPWDEPLPPDLSKSWNTFLRQLPVLSEVTIPRLLMNGSNRVQLHGYSDASSKGYSAVLYIRSVDFPFVTTLVASKTRVAPISPISIPRLELLGACLLAKLGSHYTSLLSSFFMIEETWLWCDSTIVLHWINTDPANLKTFVANRIVNILELTSVDQWRHVPGVENPADLASRGCSVRDLIHSRLWWNGPEWLSSPESHWPENIVLGHPPEPVCLELKQLEVTTCHTSVDTVMFERISSWSLLIRVATVVAKWALMGKPQLFTPLQLKELGHTYIIRYIQASSLQAEIDAVQKGRRTIMAINRLVPFVDNHGVLRARGRLFHATHLDTKCPIILPKRHPFIKLLIMHTHVKLYHAGPTQVQGHLSLTYWILSARQVIRSVIHSCVTCFRAKPRNVPPLMADLPADRVNPAPPFSVVGIDFCGPFYVKSSHLRKAPILKVYICVFICLVVKAIHLELVFDMSTDAFIDALKRCISRRGCPKRVYSDCGTNLQGGNNFLQLTLETICNSPHANELIQNFAVENNIQFVFNAPGAPHQTGLVERAVQSTKYHLKRVVGLNIYTVPQFNSIIINIEGILNSRPITTLSTSPGDAEVLTPSHFLLTRQLTSPPDADISSPVANLGKHYQAIKSVINQFWKKWKLEYLSALHSRSKWYTQTPNLQVDDIVILEEPNCSPLHWPLGRITKVFPAGDGVVRRAEVSTSAGTYLRPAIKLFRLPVEKTNMGSSGDSISQPL